MKLNKVLISTKKTALENYKEQTDFLEDILSPEDLREIRTEHEEHYYALNKIRDILTKKNIQFERTYMPYTEFEDFKGKDLIICVGGDGTVLNSAKYVFDKTPLLNIKSNKKSFGALCKITPEEFEAALENIEKDNFKLEPWTRAEGRFNGKKILALNEIFVGTKHNPAAGRYIIEHNGKSEYQISSGVIIATGTGSTGWYRNILNSGGPFPRTLNELHYIVREALVSEDYKMKKGTIFSGDTLKIISKMNVDGCISFDGDYNKRMYNFKKGDVIEISTAETPVHIISFKSSNEIQ